MTTARSIAPPPLAAPQAAGVVLQRERLHALIDARLPGAVWLHGPTGAGKTVLLRAWLRAHRCAAVWITCDARHRDPAALFAAIGAAAAAHGVGTLPGFSPEHRADPLLFADAYFARLDDALGAGHGLVFDDVHELADTTAPLLGAAIDAFGGRRRLCFASQLLPDASFAPHLAGSRLWTIGHKLLAFDEDEVRELAASLGDASPAADALVAATGGWAAGLMLAMQLGAGGATDADADDPLASVRAPLALLIAGQVLGGVAPDDLARLRLLAELPQVPMNLAEGAAEWAPACLRLQALADRGLFVERLASDRRTVPHDPLAPKVMRLATGCWRLHDLFRNALREPRVDGAPLPASARELAAGLLAIDRLDLAWHFAAQLDTALLARLVASHGSAALRSDHLLALLPVTARHADRATPTIAVWMARGLIGNDEAAALRCCEEAHAGYDALGDAAGCALTVALALFVMFSTAENVGRMATWTGRFAAPDGSVPRPAGRSEEAAIAVAGAVVHQLFVGTSDGDASQAQDELMSLVSAEVLSANENLLAAALLVAALRRTLRIDEASYVIARVEELTSCRRAAPHLRANWNIENGYHFSRVGAPERARRCFDDALAIADANALSHARVAALLGLARLAVSSGATALAVSLTAQLEAFGAAGLGRMHGLVVHVRARCDALSGRHRQALDGIELASRLVTQAGFPKSVDALIAQDRVQLLYGAGDAGESLAFARRAMKACTPADAQRIDLTRALLEAHVHLRDDPERSTALLRAHLPLAASLRLSTMLSLLPDVAAEIAAHGIAYDVCTPHLVQMIRGRQLRAPRNAPAAWPWAVRVEVLRPFRIVRDGDALVFTGKTQQKPLELLKYLVCARDAIGDAAMIATALWPDHDDGAARKNLEVTVSRLRKLLADDTLVVVRDGKVALDRTRVSSDVRELGDACVDAEDVMAGRCGPQRVQAIGNRLLALFSALPLEEEDSTAWREAVRARCKNDFLRSVRTIIAFWMDAGETRRAVPLLEAALAREPLAENLYRSLMQIHAQDGDHAEAMRVYRQCRQMLSVLIGGQPSPETERLKDAITR